MQDATPALLRDKPPLLATAARLAPKIVRPLAIPVAHPTGERNYPFSWTGNPWSLAGTCLFNTFMTLITVGVYSFWGRTEIRRRLWSSVRLDGEPLVYHGTGMELFKGFLGALLLVLLPLFVAGTAMVLIYGHASAGWGVYQLALFAVIYPVLRALATYRARRYRLARTSWRGVRGSMGGSSAEFAFLNWATSLLYPLTLAWIAPWRALYIQRFMTNDTMLGNRPLEMTGSTAQLYLRFIVLWLCSAAILFAAGMGMSVVAKPWIDSGFSADVWMQLGPSITAKIAGIAFLALFVWLPISAFYKSSLYNIVANGTTLKPAQDAPPNAPTARFKLDSKGRSLFWLMMTNQIITYGSLFVLRPISTARSMRYFADRMTLVSAMPLGDIGQNPKALLAEGEGLAQAFDFDAF